MNAGLELGLWTPRQEGLGSAAVSIAYQKATCIERSRPEATLMGPGERERKRSSPLWLEGWVKPTQGFTGNDWRGKGVPRGQKEIFFFFLPRWRKIPHNSLFHSPNHTPKYANGHKFLGDPGKPLGVGSREILHTIFVWSDHNDTHCNTLFAFISWTFLFLRGAGCFCGCRLHTWTGLRWFI